MQMGRNALSVHQGPQGYMESAIDATLENSRLPTGRRASPAQKDMQVLPECASAAMMVRLRTYRGHSAWTVRLAKLVSTVSARNVAQACNQA